MALMVRGADLAARRIREAHRWAGRWLSKGHAEKLIPTRKTFDLVVSNVTLDAFAEFVY
jgi:hypothetical protein